MAKRSIEVRINFNNLPQYKRKKPDEVADAIRALALEGEADVKMSFGTSPSPVGGPPGVDTGALRAGIHVRERSKFVYAIVDASEYGWVHEFGGIGGRYPRPFMGPMAERLSKMAPEFLKKRLKD